MYVIQVPSISLHAFNPRLAVQIAFVGDINSKPTLSGNKSDRSTLTLIPAVGEFL